MEEKHNQYWRLRKKHGKDKLFATPELLWQAAYEYFEWCINNPIVQKSYKGINEVEYKHPRPFTLKGLCIHLDCDPSYFRAFKSQERKNKDDYITVCLLYTSPSPRDS